MYEVQAVICAPWNLFIYVSFLCDLFPVATVFTLYFSVVNIIIVLTSLTSSLSFSLFLVICLSFSLHFCTTYLPMCLSFLPTCYPFLFAPHLVLLLSLVWVHITFFCTYDMLLFSSRLSYSRYWLICMSIFCFFLFPRSSFHDYYCRFSELSVLIIFFLSVTNFIYRS